MISGTDGHLARIETAGYTLLEDAVPSDVVDALVDDPARLERDLGTVPSAHFSPERSDLCGLGVYKGLIGHIDKRTPADRFYGDNPTDNLFDVT